MAHRLAPRAAADLDEIWYYLARESGSIEIADRTIDSITHRLLILADFPYLGRAREEFGKGYRSIAVGEYVIVYCVEGDDVLALRIAHGRRDLDRLFAP